jgi:hypothetical protein
MTSLPAIEIASLLGALDSAVIADGAPASAHVLRTVAMNGNRLRSKGHPLMTLAWDADESATEVKGGLFWIAPPFWVQACPGPVPVSKKPGLVKGDARIVAKVLDSHRVLFQLSTVQHPYSDRGQAGDDNMVTCTGDGDNDYDVYSLDVSEGLRLDYGPAETLTLWMRGDPSTTLMDTGTYGTPNTGTLNQAGDYVSIDQMNDASAAWNTSGNTPDKGGHAIIWKDGAGNILVSHRMIVAVDAATRLSFWPQISEAERRLITRNAGAGASYDIVKLPEVRLGAVTVVAADRGQV